MNIKGKSSKLQKGVTIKRSFLALLCLAIGIFLGQSLLTEQIKYVNLPEMVQAEINNSGVINPVTAVLLNFRSYDTLLEVSVLMLAVFCVLSLYTVQLPLLKFGRNNVGMAQIYYVYLLIPVMIVIGGYLLWAGYHVPGGAFQGGAIISAAMILLLLSEYTPSFKFPRWLIRLMLALGFCVFLFIAFGSLLISGRLLEYPNSWSGGLILIIESTLTISIAFILVVVVSGRPSDL